VPSTRSLAALGIVAALLVGSLAVAGPPADAAPPPEDVCGVCDDHFEAAVADAGGPEVTVAESRLDAWVYENGSTLVGAKIDLSRADATWVANNTDALADELAATDAGIDADKRALSVRVDDDLVFVEYVDEEFAYETFGGVVVADALTRTETGWNVNAERFAVWAPSDYVTATHVRGVAVAEWRDHADTGPLVFAPDRGPVPAAIARLALVAATWPAFLGNAAVALVPFVGVLALAFRAMDGVAEATPDVSPRTAGVASVAAGSLAALALAATGRVSLYFRFHEAVPLFAAVTAVSVGVAALAGARGALSLSLAAVGVPLSLGVVAVFVGGPAHPRVAGWTIWRALLAAGLAAQVGAFVVFGAARKRRRGRRWPAFIGLLAPVVAALVLFGSPMLVLYWALALAVLAPLAALLGDAVAGSGLRSV